jgi:hypothetical protein
MICFIMENVLLSVLKDISLKINNVKHVTFLVKNVQEIQVVNVQNVKTDYYFIKVNVNLVVPQGLTSNFHKINVFLVIQIVKVVLIQDKLSVLNVFYLNSKIFKPIYVKINVQFNNLKIFLQEVVKIVVKNVLLVNIIQVIVSNVQEIELIHLCVNVLLVQY